MFMMRLSDAYMQQIVLRPSDLPACRFCRKELGCGQCHARSFRPRDRGARIGGV